MQSSLERNISCLVDTDIAVDFLRKRPYALRLLDNWSGKGLLAASTLTHLEVYIGMRAGEEASTDAFLDGLVSIAVDTEIARRAGTMMRELRSQGKTFGVADAIIAATALQLDIPLLTNNAAHYPFQDLQVIKGMEA